MAVDTRQKLIEYCLRELGEPVIEVNIDPDQVSDRIDEALQYWQEFHVDGSARVLLKHAVTADDITQKSIPINEEIISVKKVFSANSLMGSGQFSGQYQFLVNNVFDAGYSGYIDLGYYTQVMQYLRQAEITLSGGPPVKFFSRHMDRLQIDWEWGTDIKVGEFILLDGQRLIDPTTYTDVYNDLFLKKYATALIKRQWGTNMKKFDGVQLPGGVVINGQRIYDEAIEEIKLLEEEMKLTWSEPLGIFMG